MSRTTAYISFIWISLALLGCGPKNTEEPGAGGGFKNTLFFSTGNGVFGIDDRNYGMRFSFTFPYEMYYGTTHSDNEIFLIGYERQGTKKQSWLVQVDARGEITRKIEAPPNASTVKSNEKYIIVDSALYDPNGYTSLYVYSIQKMKLIKTISHITNWITNEGTGVHQGKFLLGVAPNPRLHRSGCFLTSDDDNNFVPHYFEKMNNTFDEYYTSFISGDNLLIVTMETHTLMMYSLGKHELTSVIDLQEAAKRLPLRNGNLSWSYQIKVDDDQAAIFIKDLSFEDAYQGIFTFPLHDPDSITYVDLPMKELSNYDLKYFHNGKAFLQFQNEVLLVDVKTGGLTKHLNLSTLR